MIPYNGVTLTHWPLGDLSKILVIFKLISVTDGWGISCKIALRWMPLDLTDDMSTLVQVMAWCRQATSHYLSQCWPRFMSPYGVTRPQWVKISFPLNLNYNEKIIHGLQSIIECTSFKVWVRYFVWNFKGYLWNSTQNNLSILWNIWFLYNFEILRALGFKSS